MRKSMSGFTIVEILVVVTVIGILAVIGIITYGNMQTKTQNTERITELKAWQKSFIQYKAANGGKYPDVPSGGYCLGTGFPNQKCRNYDEAIHVYTEAASATLMSLLSTYDPPSTGSRIPVNGSIGPYVEYYSEVIHLTAVLKGVPTDCPAGTFFVWTDTERILCRIALERIDN